jgi:hypothetical protein
MWRTRLRHGTRAVRTAKDRNRIAMAPCTPSSPPCSVITPWCAPPSNRLAGMYMEPSSSPAKDDKRTAATTCRGPAVGTAPPAEAPLAGTLSRPDTTPALRRPLGRSTYVEIFLNRDLYTSPACRFHIRITITTTRLDFF